MKTNLQPDNQPTCEIIFTSLIQYCMTWDSINKCLFTGQEDGKINKWDLNKSQPLGVLACESALSDSEKEISTKKKKMEMFNSSLANKQNLKSNQNQKFLRLEALGLDRKHRELWLQHHECG